MRLRTINAKGFWIIEHGKVIKYENDHELDEAEIHSSLSNALCQRARLDECISDMRKLLILLDNPDVESSYLSDKMMEER